MLRVDDLRAAMIGFEPRRRSPERPDQRAAVAAILRDREPCAELLFILRAEHPRDPWSGHMAFPGGRVDAADRDPLAAAVREAREELALDLEHGAQHLGRLSDVTAVARGRRLGLVIEPFVFELRGEPILMPNHEVQEAVWVPLSFLSDRANRSTIDWQFGDVTVPLPCYRFNCRVIWGLTFGMVDEMISLMT